MYWILSRLPGELLPDISRQSVFSRRRENYLLSLGHITEKGILLNIAQAAHTETLVFNNIKPTVVLFPFYILYTT
jgi:hypothetical protein